MSIRKSNKMLQASVPSEVIDSMNMVCHAISKQIKRPYTKGMLITDIYTQWLEFQNAEIQKASEATKEDKEKC